MRMIRRGFRWGVHIFIPKVFNLIVIFVLVFQPVGQGGLYSIALAIESDPAAPAEDVVPAPDPVEEEENPILTETLEETPAETPTDISPEIPAETLAEIPIETPAEEPVETSAIEAEDASESEKIITDTTPVTPAEEEVTATPAESRVNETECLYASVEGDSDATWIIDEEKNTAETDEPVQLGVRYVYPLDKEVMVTFTCLPADESKRAPLKIERIKASDIDLPDGTVAVSEYAYDITTEGMDNGDFKYDLTLPKFEGVKDVDISFIEMSADEVKEKSLSESDVKKIDEASVDNKNDSVDVFNLDHFTAFITTIAIANLASPECFDDADGANDEPNQKDLTSLCQDQDSADPLKVTWNWDDVSMSGNNTADACALFDTDNDENANYAVCVTWGGSQLQSAGSPKIYTCNDTRADRCAGAGAGVSPANGSTCLVTGTDGPFGESADTGAYCSIDLVDVGGAAAARALDVCSYPSTQPNSDPSDCVVVSQNNGNLEVIKDVVPDDAATNWDITVTGPSTFNDTLQGDDSTGLRVVNPSTNNNKYSISESAGSGTNLANYTSTWSCTTNGTITSSGSGTSITDLVVSAGSIVRCTFTNTLQNGTVIVHKDVQGPSGGSVTDTSQNFSVQLDGGGTQSITDDGTVTYNDVSAGAHSDACERSNK